MSVRGKVGLKIARVALSAALGSMKREEGHLPGGHPLRLLINKERHKNVRPAARALNLAYGFLRGRALRDIERDAYKRPNWDLVQEQSILFSDEDPRVIRQRLAQWVDEAELPVEVAPRMPTPRERFQRATKDLRPESAKIQDQ